MAAVTASTKNVVGEISKSHLMSQASLYNPSNHLHNSLLMNMSINPLHLGPITGMPFPPNSAFFLGNNNDESEVADMSRRRRSLSERFEEPCYKMSRDTEDESAGEEGISGSSSGAENGSAKQAAQRNQKRPIPSEQKDGKYYERRRRNNLAAKKSRDARKTREDQLVMRVAHLEKENAIFRAQVAILREEMSVLQLFLCQKINLGAQSTAAEKSSI